MNHKSVDSAKKGQEICVKIEPIPGESPKMYGRHFEAVDIIVSKVYSLPDPEIKPLELTGCLVLFFMKFVGKKPLKQMLKHIFK